MTNNDTVHQLAEQIGNIYVTNQQQLNEQLKQKLDNLKEEYIEKEIERLENEAKQKEDEAKQKKDEAKQKEDEAKQKKDEAHEAREKIKILRQSLKRPLSHDLELAADDNQSSSLIIHEALIKIGIIAPTE
ncbi:unnamed protein product [Rotaria sordida]|uniref:Uncharacterized protein n=1 Tax=Rotaria sordida TaxID=392033 RepID=A0A814QTC1_9BILA|nr:unnamed protein product [Rotaria sordida]CAF1123911.1 unnamed protein product [Rotaria sordida]CAF1124821.1 unnamed protein product [Rotaria sordida]CAF4049257.1 unnamed protein product [Rotaria sordida]